MGNIVTSTMPLSLTRRAALREVSLVARQRAYPDCSQQPRLALAGSRRSKASLSGVADRKPNLSTQATSESENLRHPRSVQALHLKPLKREAEHGIPSCDLQLRSYSLQPLDFFLRLRFTRCVLPWLASLRSGPAAPNYPEVDCSPKSFHFQKVARELLTYHIKTL